MIKLVNFREFIEPKIVKFITVGVLNTLFGYATYAMFLYWGVSYLVALLLATIVSVIFNYLNFGKFVFYGRHNLMDFCKFVVVYAVIFGLNAAGLEVLTNDFLVSPYVGQVICILPSALLSWLLMNYWVFIR